MTVTKAHPISWAVSQLLVVTIFLNACGATDGNSSPPAQNTAPVSIEVITSNKLPEKRILATETIPQNNCRGTAEVTNEIERSRSITRILDLGATVSVGGGGEAGVPGFGSVQIGAEVAAAYGYSYGVEETVSRSLLIKARDGTNISHEIQQVEYWQTGEVVIRSGSQEIARYDYRFRTDFGLEYVQALSDPCPGTIVQTPSPEDQASVTPMASPAPTVEATVAQAPTIEPTIAPVPTVAPTVAPPTIEPTIAPVPTVAPTPIQASGIRTIFMSDRDGNREIYVLNMISGLLTRLTNNDFDDDLPAWSPGQDKVAFVSKRDGNQEIYLMDSNGQGQVNITNSPGNDFLPTWSPDGRRIAFVSDRSGHKDIFVMDQDGKNIEQITNDASDDDFPTWSNDGQMIAFSTNREGQYDIYIANLEGKLITRLNNGSEKEQFLDWSPDGRYIAFDSDQSGDRDVYTINIATLEVTRLTNTALIDGDPSWSPDGSKIVFVSFRDSNENPLAVGHLYIMGSDGRNQERLTFDGTRNWAPNWSSP